MHEISTVHPPFELATPSLLSSETNAEITGAYVFPCSRYADTPIMRLSGTESISFPPLSIKCTVFSALEGVVKVSVE